MGCGSSQLPMRVVVQGTECKNVDLPPGTSIYLRAFIGDIGRNGPKTVVRKHVELPQAPLSFWLHGRTSKQVYQTKIRLALMAQKENVDYEYCHGGGELIIGKNWILESAMHKESVFLRDNRGREVGEIVVHLRGAWTPKGSSDEITRDGDKFLGKPDFLKSKKEEQEEKDAVRQMTFNDEHVEDDDDDDVKPNDRHHHHNNSGHQHRDKDKDKDKDRKKKKDKEGRRSSKVSPKNNDAPSRRDDVDDDVDDVDAVKTPEK